MIAAPKSGSGKTLITCALLGALKKQNMDVMAYKCGPDYIDPMFHRTVLEIETENLDTYFSGEDLTKSIFLQGVEGHDIAVIEGVMGLFDGLGGVREEGSAYHLATVTKTPIILVVDVHGMGKSMIPLIKGFEMYDNECLIKGIILNRISEHCYETMKPELEKEINIPILGYFPNRKDIHLESRHLGLVMPEEIEGIKEQLKAATEQFFNGVNIKNLLDIASNAEDIYDTIVEESNQKKKVADVFKQEAEYDENNIVLAVARDSAFCFYYEANIREFKKRGVVVKYFSPLVDEKLPEDAAGLLLGGGYPELYGKSLSDNVSMKESIKNAIEAGMPSLAECGGFMYLHKLIVDDKGNKWGMVGAIDGEVSYKGKLVRFGYVEIKEKESIALKKDSSIKAHEFHYYDSTVNGNDCIATKPVNKKKWSCIHAGENYFWGFPHLYYPSAPEFIDWFVECMKKYRRNR